MGTLKMLFQLIALTVFSSTFVSCSNIRTQEKRDLLCDICMDIVTDIDEWITSDSTMDEIVQFVEGICSSLGWIGEDLENLCRQLIEENLPDIIDVLWMIILVQLRSVHPLVGATSLLLQLQQHHKIINHFFKNKSILDRVLENLVSKLISHPYMVVLWNIEIPN